VSKSASRSRRQPRHKKALNAPPFHQPQQPRPFDEATLGELARASAFPLTKPLRGFNNCRCRNFGTAFPSQVTAVKCQALN